MIHILSLFSKSLKQKKYHLCPSLDICRRLTETEQIEAEMHRERIVYVPSIKRVREYATKSTDSLLYIYIVLYCLHFFLESFVKL